MLQRKVPVYFVFLTFLISGVCFFLVHQYTLNRSEEVAEDFTPNEPSKSVLSCNFNISRLNGFQFIHPLLYAEPFCESEELQGCKNQINQLISQHKTAGDINTASVYLRVFNQAKWIAVNEDELYSPGSLLKVPELIAFYKMNERNPGFLDKEILYNTNLNQSNRILTFESKHIQLGKKYKVRELLYYMIVYSDNDATMVLNSIVDKNIFSKVFSDFGMKEPDYSSGDYKMTAKNYSTFLKVLYNASYLDFKASEECLSLLSKSTFNDGLVGGLPSNCTVAHKFGEGGANNAPNFSETALVYCGNNPYIITIMMKGNDMKKLPGVSKDISKKVFSLMNASS